MVTRKNAKEIIKLLQCRMIDYSDMSNYYTEDKLEDIFKPYIEVIKLMDKDFFEEIEYRLYEAPSFLQEDGCIKIKSSGNSYRITNIEEYLDYMVSEGLITEDLL